MKFRTIALISLLVACIAQANAGMITIERAELFLSGTNIDLKAKFNELDVNNIVTEDMPNSSIIYSGNVYNNSIFKLSFDFISANNSTFDVIAGLDAGHGAELWVNGTLEKDVNSNIWWARDFNNAQVLKASGININAGSNLVELFWAENFNSGGNSFQFSFGGQDIQELNDLNLANAMSVPSPSIFILVVLSVVGFIFKKQYTA